MSRWNLFKRDARAFVEQPKYRRPYCTHPDEKLARVITVRGHNQVAWYCFKCADYSRRREGHGAEFIKHSELIGVVIDALPIITDNSSLNWYVDSRKETCAHCGEFGFTDMHHFAPKHLFGDDADNWPTAQLCRACHTLWHRAVTPRMNRRKHSD